MSKQNELAQLADAVTVDGSNVGIGTTSPSTKLSVTGGYISQVNAGVSTYLGEDGSGGSLVGTTSNHYFRFITNNTERLRIDSDGLKFNGDTAAANALDDYETGTWTPVVASWSGTLGSVSGQVGHYIKIGKLVQLFYQFNVTNLGTASGGIFITGKPFTEDNSVISYYAGLNRPRSGTSGISELDVGGDIYLYGSSLTVSLYCGSITYKST